ncbi:MAG TPA: HEAT repeat domain-containing protein, partial [Acidobacteriota bacterium]|nr:HEAT repeat domain-containing protein [Acidobacteriota bacterium]
NLVWIGTEEAIWQYNFQTGKLRFFLNDELGARATGRWDSFWFEKEFVWVTSTLNPAAGLFRFSTATEHWVRFQDEPVELSQVIGLLDGKLWVMFFTPTQYQLPGYINSQTMKLIPVPLQGDGQIPFVRFIGCDQNQPVFSQRDQSAYRFDPMTHQLKPLSQSANQIELDVPCGLRGYTIQIQSNGVVTGKSASPWPRCDVFGRPFSGVQWRLLTLPNRTQVVGAWPGESILFGKTPRPDQQYLTHFPTSSGLRFRFPNGETRLQTLPESQENILGDTIFSLSIDQENQAVWACTDYGVSILDRNFELLKTLTHREGMASDRVVNGTQQGNNWFFRHSLILPEYVTQFDLKTGQLTAKPSHLPRMGLIPNNPQKIISFVELPFLGGPVFGQTVFRQKCCLYGSRGLVVLDRTSVLCQLKYNSLQIQTLPGQTEINQSALNLATLPKIQTLDDLRAHLQTANPLLLAQLLYSLHSSQLLSQPDLISLLTPFLHHPHRRVRGTTLFILQNIDSPVVMDAIKQLTNDSDEGIRAVTALELAKRST